MTDAKKACELDKWKSADYIDTLAAAYAEAGDFESAIRYEEQAISTHDASESQSTEMQKRRALYQDHKPYRQTRTP